MTNVSARARERESGVASSPAATDFALSIPSRAAWAFGSRVRHSVPVRHSVLDTYIARRNSYLRYYICLYRSLNFAPLDPDAPGDP